MADRDARNRAAAKRALAGVPRYRRESPEAAIARITGAQPSTGGDDGAFEREAFARILGGVPRAGGRGGGLKTSLAPTPSRRSGSGPALSSKPRIAASTPDVAELREQRALATALTGRLRSVEEGQRRLRTELVSKDQEVVRLRAELAEVRAAGKAASGGASAAAEESASLRRERDALRRQVADMESFLNDYGLVWVGGGEEEASQGGGKHERAYSGFDLALDFGVLAARVQELNALAGGDGAKRAVTRGGVTRLEDAEHVPVTVWRDGFMLWRGPFRAAPSAEAQSFLRDVLDGFFPSELKGAYPDGVLLRLVDRTEEAYDGSAAGPGPGVQRGAASRADKPGFAGEGRSLGGGPCAGAAADDTAAAEAKAAAAGGRPVAATRPRGGPVGLADIGDPDLDMARPMGRDEFLSRVPETVMRGGRVIKVREGLGDLMGASSAAGRPDVVIARTPAVEAIRGLEGAAGTAEAARPASAAMGATFRASPADGGAPADTSEVTTLVVRSDSGRQTLVVKLGFDDTIADLREYVDRYRAKEGDYDLVTAFPRKAYTDPAQSLRDAGLVPNAKLMIRPR